MRPVLNVRIAQEFLKITFPAAQKAINALVEAGILTEITGGKRNKTYAAKEVLETLEAEISPQQV
jgi:Fic family protein